MTKPVKPKKSGRENLIYVALPRGDFKPILEDARKLLLARRESDAAITLLNVGYRLLATDLKRFFELGQQATIS